MNKQINLNVDEVKTPWGMYVFGVILTMLIPIIGLPVLVYTYVNSTIKHQKANIYEQIYKRKTQYLNNGQDFYFIQTNGDTEIPQNVNFNELVEKDSNKVLVVHNSHPYLVTFLFLVGMLVMCALCGNIMGLIMGALSVFVVDPQMKGRASDEILSSLITTKETTLNFTNNRKCNIKVVKLDTSVTDTGDYITKG